MPDIFTVREFGPEVTPEQQCVKAVAKALERIQSDPHISYLIGIGTSTYNQLTEAHSAITGEDLEAIRKHYLHEKPVQPLVKQDEEDQDGDDDDEEEEHHEKESLTEADVIGYINDLPVPDRMEFLRSMREQFCPRCGAIHVVRVGKSCGCSGNPR